jgi:hypothetical protein
MKKFFIFILLISTVLIKPQDDSDTDAVDTQYGFKSVREDSVREIADSQIGTLDDVTDTASMQSGGFGTSGSFTDSFKSVSKEKAAPFTGQIQVVRQV